MAMVTGLGSLNFKVRLEERKHVTNSQMHVLDIILFLVFFKPSYAESIMQFTFSTTLRYSLCSCSFKFVDTVFTI